MYMFDIWTQIACKPTVNAWNLICRFADSQKKFIWIFNFKERGDQDESAWCNGSQEFCDLRFDQFLFPGTHNSGTGQKKGVFQCSSKNQDLTISQQLDFGIRFFDLDIINRFN